MATVQPAGESLFKEFTNEAGIRFAHTDIDFNEDFNIQTTLPHKLSEYPRPLQQATLMAMDLMI
jgi:hypothetical protein